MKTNQNEQEQVPWPEDIHRRNRAIAEKRQEAVAKIVAELSPGTYGQFAEASLMLGCSIPDSIDLFLNSTDAISEWINDGCLTTADYRSSVPPNGVSGSG